MVGILLVQNDSADQKGVEANEGDDDGVQNALEALRAKRNVVWVGLLVFAFQIGEELFQSARLWVDGRRSGHRVFAFTH